MKVAYILESFPNISATFVINEIFAMQEKGVEVGVFAFHDYKEKLRHAKAEGIRQVRYFNSRQYFGLIYAHAYFLIRRPLRYISTAVLSLLPHIGIARTFLFELHDVRVVSRYGPDILHAHFGRHAADFCMLAHMLTGVPFTFTTHGFDVHRQPPANYRVKSQMSYRHITISEFNKAVLMNRHKVPEDKLSVIRCGVDFDCLPPRTDPNTENMIICVARLQYIKGIDLLIRACKKLSERGLCFRCEIIGEGPQRYYLEQLICELDLDKIVLLRGALTHDMVFEALGRAKMMVLASRSESLSVALMEAMACRVPVVGPDIMGNPELVTDGVSGYLVKSGDIDVLAERIARLLADKELGRRFSDAAYDKVCRDFNLQKETQKLLELWRGCTEAGRG